MSDHKRFGIDATALASYIKNGVDSLEKVHEICSLLHTNVEEGLPPFPAHLSLRQSAFGKNEYAALPSHHSLSFLALLSKSYTQLQPRFIRNILVILIFCAVISFILEVVIKYGGGHSDDSDSESSILELVILIVSLLEPLTLLFVPILLETCLSYRKQGTIATGLKRLRSTDRSAMVKRGANTLVPVKFEDVVVGDIVQLNPGDVVPGDGLLLQKNELVFDTRGSYSSLGFCVTGGSVVKEGKGEAVVVAVGQNTQLSVITNEPLQAQQRIPVTFILVIATVFGLSLFITMMARFSLDTFVLQRMAWDERYIQRILKFIGFGFRCFLKVIPVSLPFAIVWSFFRAKDNSRALLGIFKFIQFKMTLNIVIASVVFINDALISNELLTTIQQLWINLWTTSLALLLYPTDLASANRPIEGFDQILVLSGETLRNIFGQVVWQLGLLGGLVYFSKEVTVMEDPLTYNTLIFNCLALMTLFHLFCVRIGRLDKNCFAGIMQKPVFCILWIFAIISQVVIVQMGGLLFHVNSLGLYEHLLCLCGALSVFIWSYILACICLRSRKEQPNRACDYENNETEL